jgi:hypothetical protein
MAYLTGLAQSTDTATGLATVMGIISAESKNGFPSTQISVIEWFLQPDT